MFLFKVDNRIVSVHDSDDAAQYARLQWILDEKPFNELCVTKIHYDGRTVTVQ